MAKKDIAEDPFVETIERGTYVQETMKGQEMKLESIEQSDVVQTIIMGVLDNIPRLSDYQPGLDLIPLDEIDDQQVILWKADLYEGEKGEFATMELSFPSSPEERFLANCGGENVKAAIKKAFASSDGPFGVAFHKIITSRGRALWTMR